MFFFSTTYRIETGPEMFVPAIANSLARLAWGHLCPDAARFEATTVAAALEAVIDQDVIELWFESVVPTEVELPLTQPVECVQRMLSDDRRRRAGIFLTPKSIARGMAAALDDELDGPVVDLSAGAATLLAAAVEQSPRRAAVGIEREPALAVAAAIQLVAQRRRSGGAVHPQDRIFIGDGLARDSRWEHLEGSAAAVVGNPPYVREKGNRELFDDLKERHEHLADFFGPRMDLQYLFFHRSASLLRERGSLVFLTTSYWLSATNADRLRADLSTRIFPAAFIRVEPSGLFADAPGQHSLISIFRRTTEAGQARSISLSEPPDDWAALTRAMLEEGDSPPPGDAHTGIQRVPSGSFGAAPWSPFADLDTRRWAERLRDEGTCLSSLLDDRQGFVSGADRFTGRHPKRYPESAEQLPERGEAIFLFAESQRAEALSALGASVVRPLLRANSLRPNDVVLSPRGDERVLFVDDWVGADNEGVLEDYLGRFRPVLAHRREARRGSMPWYRLHWPRSRSEQTRPKLVVPRRAPRPCFALDLSASAVSSDCTYLIAPEGLADPIRYLVTIMVVLNSRVAHRYLRHFGKSKGDQLEFYSEPLRSLPLPLVREGDELRWVPALLPDGEAKTLADDVEGLLASL